MVIEKSDIKVETEQRKRKGLAGYATGSLKGSK